MVGIDASVHSPDTAALAPTPAPSKPQREGFSFDDFLDIINPLQHIPVVSTIYRHLTGDTIRLPEKIVGDGLYGGVVGLLCSLGDALFQEITGRNLGDTAYAFVTGEDEHQTVLAKSPVSVTPASSISFPQIPMPDFSGLIDTGGDEATGPPRSLSPLVAQRAASAYRHAAVLAN